MAAPRAWLTSEPALWLAALFRAMVLWAVLRFAPSLWMPPPWAKFALGGRIPLVTVLPLIVLFEMAILPWPDQMPPPSASPTVDVDVLLLTVVRVIWSSERF